LTPPDDLRQFYRRALGETLDAVVTSQVRDELLRRALNLASLRDFPDDPAVFAFFVGCPLRLVLSDALGAELTDTLSTELEYLARASRRPPEADLPPSSRGPISPGSQPIGAVSLKKSRSRDSAQSPPPGEPPLVNGPASNPLPPMLVPTPLSQPMSSRPAPSAKPASGPASHVYPNGTASALGLEGSAAPASRIPTRVFLATRHSRFEARLAALVNERTEVIRIDDVMDLLRHLNEGPARNPVLVVDCLHSSLRPIALAALADDLPGDVRVILWGASTSLRAQIAQLAPVVESWIVIESRGDDLRTLALRCESQGG
jgi:hypothetical protein